MLRFLRRLTLFSLLGVVAWASWNWRDQIYSFYQQHFGQHSTDLEPDPETYQELIGQLQSHRSRLAERYATARTAPEIKAVMNEARKTLERDLPAMMRCWLGTPWDFNGTCETPGSGKIACGYFVSTILRDAGFQIERVRLAQQASQNIIATLVPKAEMHIRTGMKYDEFLNQIVARGLGIRIVGLDKHVAFLVIGEHDRIHFIHSTQGSGCQVVDEDRSSASALRASRYRVTGNLTGSDHAIHNWLTGTFLVTRN